MAEDESGTTEHEEPVVRLKYFGRADLSTPWQAAGAFGLVADFVPEVSEDVNDVIELHNALRIIESGAVPDGLDRSVIDRANSRMKEARRHVGRYFGSIQDGSVASRLGAVEFEYRSDVLALLARAGKFDTLDRDSLLAALDKADFHLHDLLSNQHLVEAWDEVLRNRLLSEPQHAEFLVRRLLLKDADDIHLPRSLSAADATGLLDRYLDSERPNANYVSLIENAPAMQEVAIDGKLRLKARRRRQDLVDRILETGTRWTTGVDLEIVDDQATPAKQELEDMVLHLSLSRRWLEQSLDYPSILNNVQHVFQFLDHQCLLTMPAHEGSAGLFEQLFAVRGRKDYPTDSGFQMMDGATLLLTHAYRQFLASHEIDLELVISWFFEEYLLREFDISGFRFHPTGEGASPLLRARHLFAEMESIARQYAAFVRDGEVDWDLISISSEPVIYRAVPSIVPEKYAYSSGGEEVSAVAFLLFSDQSLLTQVESGASAESLAQLLSAHRLRAEDFSDFQQARLQTLLNEGVVAVRGEHLSLSSVELLSVLRKLHEAGCLHVERLSEGEQAEVQRLADRGWLVCEGSLLSRSEASYFNYFLNRAEFSNGPDLRNRYLHGSQPSGDGGDQHHRDVVIALRMILALVLKINDELCLQAGDDVEIVT